MSTMSSSLVTTVSVGVGEKPTRDKDPGRPSYQDYDRDGGDKPRKYKTEICRHFDRGYCKLGNRCNFAHGDSELSGSTSASTSMDKQDVLGRASKDEDSRRVCGRSRFVIIHIDELDLPRRPQIEPAATDREVFVDPMPEEEHLSSCLAAFGDVDEVFILSEHHSDRAGRRGYVKFTDHAAAVRCVRAEFGTWSESERTLSSQRSHRQPGVNVGAAYPDSVVARLVGARGAEIQRLQDECGASWLHLRGEDLGRSDHRFPASSRVHFVAEGDERTFERVRGVLERRLAEIHDSIHDRIREADGRGRPRATQDPLQPSGTRSWPEADQPAQSRDIEVSGGNGAGGGVASGPGSAADRPWDQPPSAPFGGHWGGGWGVTPGAGPPLPPPWHYGGWGYGDGHGGHHPPPPGWPHYPPPPEGYWPHPPPDGRAAWAGHYPPDGCGPPPPGGDYPGRWWGPHAPSDWVGCSTLQPHSQATPEGSGPTADGIGGAPGTAEGSRPRRRRDRHRRGNEGRRGDRRRRAGDFNSRGGGERRRRRRESSCSSYSSYPSGESDGVDASPPVKRQRRRST